MKAQAEHPFVLRVIAEQGVGTAINCHTRLIECLIHSEAMAFRTRHVDIDQGRATEFQGFTHAATHVIPHGDRGLCNVGAALGEGHHCQVRSGIVYRRQRNSGQASQSHIELREDDNLDRQTGVEQPGDLSQSMSCQDLTAADQNQWWAELFFLGSQIVPAEVFCLGLCAYFRIDCPLGSAQQANGMQRVADLSL